MRTQPREVILGMGIRYAEGLAFDVYGVFMIADMSRQLELSRTLALLAVSSAAAVSLVTIPLYGGLSDRIGRRKVYAFGALTFGLFALPSFVLINTRESALIWAALLVAFGFFYPAIRSPRSGPSSSRRACATPASRSSTSSRGSSRAGSYP